MGRARGLTTGAQDAFASLLGTRRGLDDELAGRRAEAAARPRPFTGLDGATVYYRDNDEVAAVVHREDGPAIEHTDGDKQWYRDGELHREDGPAIEYSDGEKQWWRDGKRHREDGPAIECADGSELWYRDGQLHREDGPAIENADGTEQWYRDGQRYREDGPVIDYAGGYRLRRDGSLPR